MENIWSRKCIDNTQPTKHRSSAQPAVNAFRTHTLAYRGAKSSTTKPVVLIKCRTSHVIYWYYTEGGKKDGRWVQSCCELFPLVTGWLMGSRGSLVLSSITRVYLSCISLAWDKIHVQNLKYSLYRMDIELHNREVEKSLSRNIVSQWLSVVTFSSLEYFRNN